MLRNIGINLRELRLIHNLHMEKRVNLSSNQGETDSVKIRRGVRQGCCMSHILFNAYGEYLMKEALSEVGDIKTGGRIINKGRCADDFAIITKTQEKL